MSDEVEEVVKVLFDYKYSDENGQIQIKAGDIYRLVEKTNSEWWQVYDPSDENGECFFVPAQYVKIVSEKSPWKALSDLDKLLAFGGDSDKPNNNTDTEEVVEYSNELDLRQLNNVVSQADPQEDLIIRTVEYVNVPSEANRIIDEGEYVNLDQFRDLAGLPSVSQTSQPSVPTIASEQSKEEWSGIPDDYEQVHDNGSVYFIHKTTQDKWKRLVDKVGRQYYHKLGSADTQWKLPTSPGPPQTENLLQTSEPSVQHRDTNWESQGHRLSTFGGQSMRTNKAKSSYGQIETTTSSNRSATLPANFPGIRSVPPANDKISNTSSGLTPQRPTNLQTSNSTGLLHLQALEPMFLNHSIHEGYLYKTKIVDVSKKKIKKNWTQIYVVLQGSNLVFYKDQKSAAHKQGSPFGKPEGVVSLQGAHVELNPKEHTSKKNTLSLRVSAGNVYLFQSDSEKENLEWFMHMKLVARDVSPQVETSPRDVDTQEVKKEDKKSEKGMVRSLSADEYSNLHGIDKNKNLVGIRAKLLNLISRRPTQEDLYKRGIIKDAVFGSRLQELCEREKVNVPNFLQKCIAAVEFKGITHDGLYRISGNMAEIQRLRCAVDTDDTYNLRDEQWDIHVLTGALKLFFRELKEPVFPFNMYDKFSDAIKKELKKDKLSAFKSAISNLPKCNYATLKELFLHLCKVVDSSHLNRMQTQNVAIVFGPTLLWQLSPVEGLAVQTVYQSRIVEFILLEYNELFK
uniref:Rho GTPase-activating protein 12 n=1 Tax=Arion vulgaris TaxID=1028688 RepID=A0A0B7A6W8_9EUPU